MVAKNPKNRRQSCPLALTSPKQRQGQYFEQQARLFLQKKGLQWLASNWQQPKVGEIDLVMLEVGCKWSTLVFIEVRQRQRTSFGDAALSVTTAKQRRIIKTAQYFLQQHPEYADYDCRFDVLAYDIDKNSVQPNGYHNKINYPQSVEDIITDANTTYQPEWFIGAFVASAW